MKWNITKNLDGYKWIYDPKTNVFFLGYNNDKKDVVVSQYNEKISGCSVFIDIYDFDRRNIFIYPTKLVAAPFAFPDRLSIIYKKNLNMLQSEFRLLEIPGVEVFLEIKENEGLRI
jgi:hypothetical protein